VIVGAIVEMTRTMGILPAYCDELHVGDRYAVSVRQLAIHEDPAGPARFQRSYPLHEKRSIRRVGTNDHPQRLCDVLCLQLFTAGRCQGIDLFHQRSQQRRRVTIRVGGELQQTNLLLRHPFRRALHLREKPLFSRGGCPGTLEGRKGICQGTKQYGLLRKSSSAVSPSMLSITWLRAARTSCRFSVGTSLRIPRCAGDIAD
jgi:hypothetical protein